jgi:hypothetical protein
MLMGAAVIGCLAATMTSGASAQEANTTGQSNARTGQQPATSAQPNGSMRRGQGANMNARLNARANSNGTSANGQLERHGSTRASTREGRGYAAQRGMRVSVARTRVFPRSVTAVAGAASADCMLALAWKAATVLALPTISSKALQNIAQTPNGIGQTAAGTKPSTTIIARRCGTFDVTRRLGVFGSAFFQVRLYVRQPAGSPAAPEDGQIHRGD